jgi:hypothetical protein
VTTYEGQAARARTDEGDDGRVGRGQRVGLLIFDEDDAKPRCQCLWRAAWVRIDPTSSRLNGHAALRDLDAGSDVILAHGSTTCGPELRCEIARAAPPPAYRDLLNSWALSLALSL